MLKMLVVSILALTVLASGVPADADDTIYKGLDIWYTPPGGGNITVNIPAGFFCFGNSGPLTREIPLKGRPLVTDPTGQIHPGDTVVDREADIQFNGGLVASGNLRIRALDLVGVQPFPVSCPGGVTESYNTEVSLNGAQSLGTIEIRKNSVNDRHGTFDASFRVNAKIRFINTANNVPTAYLTRTDTITTLGAPWCHDPAPGAVVCIGPVTMDTDGNRVADYVSSYCTSNYFAGCTYSNGVPARRPVEHQGPHPMSCSAPGPDCTEYWEYEGCWSPYPNCAGGKHAYRDSYGSFWQCNSCSQTPSKTSCYRSGNLGSIGYWCS